MNLGKLRVFATMLALTAVCCFTDTDLASSGGTAVAEEPETAHTAQETGADGVESAEQVSEASEAQENASEGDSGTFASRPADTDEG